MPALPIKKVATALLLVSSLVLLSCSEEESGPTAADVSTTAGTELEPSSSQSSEKIEYPRLVSEYVDPTGAGMTGSGNGVLPSLIEAEFDRLTWTSHPAKTSLTVELDPENSLKIQGLQGEIAGVAQLVAVWQKPEKAAEGLSVIVTHVSPALNDSSQALALLKSFAAGDGGFETAVEWSVHGEATEGDPGNSE